MTLAHIVYGLIVAFLWGANYVAIKIGLVYFPPYLLLAFRFMAVALMLLPFFPRCSISWRVVGLVSLVLGFGHFVLIYEGMHLGLDVATTIITAQLNVPFSCLLATVFFGDRLGAWRSLGMVVSFVGVMMIVGTPNASENFLPFMLVVAGALGWAFTNIIMKRQNTMNMMELLPWLSLLLIPQMLLFSWFAEREQWQGLELAIAPQAAGAILFSAVGSTVIAFGLWHYLLRRYDVSQVAPFTLLVPVFGILIGQWLVDEAITAQVLAGGAVTLAGVGVIIIRRPRLGILGKAKPITVEDHTGKEKTV